MKVSYVQNPFYIPETPNITAQQRSLLWGVSVPWSWLGLTVAVARLLCWPALKQRLRPPLLRPSKEPSILNHTQFLFSCNINYISKLSCALCAYWELTGFIVSYSVFISNLLQDSWSGSGWPPGGSVQEERRRTLYPRKQLRQTMSDWGGHCLPHCIKMLKVGTKSWKSTQGETALFGWGISQLGIPARWSRPFPIISVGFGKLHYVIYQLLAICSFPFPCHVHNRLTHLKPPACLF